MNSTLAVIIVTAIRVIWNTDQTMIATIALRRVDLLCSGTPFATKATLQPTFRVKCPTLITILITEHPNLRPAAGVVANL